MRLETCLKSLEKYFHTFLPRIVKITSILYKKVIKLLPTNICKNNEGCISACNLEVFCLTD